MSDRLLITLRSSGAERTFAFDPSVQEVLWVGLARTVDTTNALALLEVKDGTPLLRPVGDAAFVAVEGDALEVAPGGELLVRLWHPEADDPVWLHLRPTTRGLRRYRRMRLPEKFDFAIGSAADCGLRYENAHVAGRHARLSCDGGAITVTDLEGGMGTLVNGELLAPLHPRLLAVGDVVQVLDLTVAVCVDCLCFNEPAGLTVHVSGARFSTPGMQDSPWPDVEPRDDDPALFYPAPRLSKTIRPLHLQVDDPPARKPEDQQPAIMQIGPSFLMGLASVFMAASSVLRLMGGADALSVAPSIAMSVAMIGGSVVWPMVARAYGRRRDARDEVRRGRMYVAYLDGIENQLAGEADFQAQTLRENRRPVGELVERARTLSPLLMNRTSAHDDFMDLRVGVGDASILSDIRWPERHFSLVDDRMLDAVADLAANPPMLHDVPLAFDPAKNFIAGIIGDRDLAWEFLRGLLVQVCSLYSYQEVKVVVVSSPEERAEWDFLSSLGHLYDASGTLRLVALTHAGMVERDLLLEREIERRAALRAEVLADYGTYFLVVCADHDLSGSSEAIGRIRGLRANLGFSLLYLGHDLSELPRECSYIIDLSAEGGANLGISLETSDGGPQGRSRSARMFERSDVSGTLEPFDPDIMVTREQARAFALDLARVRLDTQAQRTTMPESVGFLELFRAGSAAHLNVAQRWMENNASQTLETPVGINAQGGQALLNLHENIHGPHGLIAGTTGSGKSEFIITYVLSLCVNFAPDEVAFVLIDYKGGGLAGAFENERHHLPHLAGTITNLDGSAIRRSLVSIQSELKRRQDLFNQARDATGEATMDIYKYLSYYRQGELREPLPHLFIVADEFAELKDQEPEFMDELISAARIGRSLGVHLILATQKPTGVVNDQIWSNARFKVCLKVSDAADSREMIRRDDAAEITLAGRYYLLVGYNESFSAGQAAYAGMTYVPRDHFEPYRDIAVELLDQEGASIARLRQTAAETGGAGSQLNAVLRQIEEAARITGKQARRLWLDPLPAHVSLASLTERYGEPARDGLACVIGEIDDPENQRMLRFAPDLAALGNIMLYGSQASGVDELAEAMLVSLAMLHDAGSMWMYAVDLGAGTLAELEELPQVGGVVLAGDEERLENLLRMLEAEVVRRRRALVEHGGSIEGYNRSSGQVMPRVVVAITNIAALVELHPDLEDRLVMLTRDAPRYGIHFVVTASTANAARMRLRANFALDVPTMLNDRTDYVSILGTLRGVTPPQQEKRGLAKVGRRILEFQGASVGEPDEDPRCVIEALARSTRVACDAVAPPIPQLPACVHVSDMGAPASALALPVGFSKRGIESVWFDLGASPYMLVLGDDMDSLGRYLRGLHDACLQAEGLAYRFVDDRAVLGWTDDPNVLRTTEEVEGLAAALGAGTLDVELIVFTSIAQTVAELPAASSQMLQDYMANERGAGRTSLVAASEFWRVRSLYQDWFKVVSAYGNGVWAGGGFAEQTTLRFGRSLPEYRQPAERSDGFLVMRGKVTWVRLLEASDEPVETE